MGKQTKPRKNSSNAVASPAPAARPSALLDTRVVYCGDCPYIDYMRSRCVVLARVLKKTGSFYYYCDWHASHYVKVILLRAPQRHR